MILAHSFRRTGVSHNEEGMTAHGGRSVWQRLLSPEENRKQRQRHGEVEKVTSKDILHSSSC